MCLRNTLKDFAANNKKSTGLNEYVFEFTVSYETIDIGDITNIHQYLMKKNDII